MNKKLAIANWKCHKTSGQAIEWIDIVGNAFSGSDDFEVVVCPPFTVLASVSARIKERGYKIEVGAQNVSQFERGAYTGEVSAEMLCEFVKFTLIGHSERRGYFGEKNQDIDQKVLYSLKYGIKPIVLVRDLLDSIPDKIEYFAWEPVSAIGTGKSIDREIASQTILSLGKDRPELFGMYGGSVNKDTIYSYMSDSNIYGVVVGSASFEAKSFLELLNAIHKV